MKKIIFLLGVFALVIVSKDIFAQMEQGKVLLGLSTRFGLPDYSASMTSDVFSMGFSSVKYKSDDPDFEESDPDKLTSISLQPKVGVFVIDNLALGLDFNLSSLTYKDGVDDDKSITTVFGAGPFVRYYIPFEKVKPFVEANALFGSLKNKYDSSNQEDTDYKSSIFLIGGGAGVAIPLGDRVTFDILAGYNSYTFKDKEDNEENFRTIVGTFGIKFGFVVFLGKNKAE